MASHKETQSFQQNSDIEVGSQRKIDALVPTILSCKRFVYRKGNETRADTYSMVVIFFF
jgi:hypothetical protein